MRRTQIYLTEEQVAQLQTSAHRHGTSMAELIRRSVDAFLRRDAGAEPEAALASTFGALPDLAVPDRNEWERGRG